MANFSAIMVLFRFYIGIPIMVIVILSLAEGSTPPKSKRQIYREQVLPSRGGKIPDAAFQTDRLALNRLNKEGISIPDGVLLEHRLVHNHPHINQHDPEDEDSVIRIIQRPEDRYVPPEGKKHFKRPPTVSSTYIIRKPIGPESAAIRPPLEQTPHHEIINQLGNHIYQPPYQETYYHQTYNPHYIQKPRLQGQKFVFPEQPSIKYLPAEVTSSHLSPPKPYLSADVSTPYLKFISSDVPPPQKYLPAAPTPSNKYLPVAPTQKFLPAGSPSHKYLPSVETPPTATVVHHPPVYGYAPPVSYQQVQQSVAYEPKLVQLQIPNKDVVKNEYYYAKNQGNAYGNHRDSEDIHSAINWPYLLGQYTRLADKINGVNHDSYIQPTSQSLFFTPEVLGSIDSGAQYYTTRDRYARKSKEIAFTENTQELNEKNQPRDGTKLIKLKCTSKLENAVEDSLAQCYIRY